MSFESFVNSFSDNIEIKPLSEASDVIDSLHKTPNYSEKGIPMVRVTDIKGGFLKTNNSLKVEETVYKEFTKNHIPQKGDMVMSRVGTYGISSYINGNQKFCLGQNTVVIVPKINSQYLYYCLQSPFVKNQIEYLVVGSTQKTISLKSIRSLKIPICEPELQKLISSVLFTIDYKIEIDNRINKTLEEMAQAIFKSWFVDFEPFMDGEFEDSELGRIPKGWQIGVLGDIALNLKDSIKSEDIPMDMPYIGLEHMPRKCIALSIWENNPDLSSNKYRFKQGDILFGKLRPYFHKVGFAMLDGVCSTDILVINPKHHDWYGFTLCYVSSNEFVNYTNATSTGTKMPRTNWSDMARYQIIIPPIEIVSNFNNIIQTLLGKIKANVLENHILINLRDTLLPKLMSGEIRVPIDIPGKEAD